jgi:hypothetical protein
VINLFNEEIFLIEKERNSWPAALHVYAVMIVQCVVNKADNWLKSFAAKLAIKLYKSS